jgi:hypothetical protein
LAAVESTPLVREGATATANGRTASNKSATGEAILVVGLWNNLVWCATGMPVWCVIARHGQVRLQQHIHDLALKSPHPIRIGDVEYKRVHVATSAATEDNDPDESPSTLVRKHSLPHLHNLSTLPLASSGGGGGPTGINQKIGQGLLLAQQKKSTASSSSTVNKNDENAAMEADPQQDPPQWSDFILAIGYLLLGLVAMIAGIYSIFVSK